MIKALTLRSPHGLYYVKFDHEDNSGDNNGSQRSFWNVIEIRREKLKRNENENSRINAAKCRLDS